jgi:hypothetical protein
MATGAEERPALVVAAKRLFDLLAKSDGRDKFLATLQYLALYASAGEAGAALTKVAGNLGQSRKPFRVLKVLGSRPPSLLGILLSVRVVGSCVASRVQQAEGRARMELKGWFGADSMRVWGALQPLEIIIPLIYGPPGGWPKNTTITTINKVVVTTPLAASSSGLAPCEGVGATFGYTFGAPGAVHAPLPPTQTLTEPCPFCVAAQDAGLPVLLPRRPRRVGHLRGAAERCGAPACPLPRRVKAC